MIILLLYFMDWTDLLTGVVVIIIVFVGMFLLKEINLTIELWNTIKNNTYFY